MTTLDYSKIDCIQVEGIDYKDYPDFCDAFIVYAEYEGRPMTEEELEEINYDSDFVYNQVLKFIY